MFSDHDSTRRTLAVKVLFRVVMLQLFFWTTSLSVNATLLLTDSVSGAMQISDIPDSLWSVNSVKFAGNFHTKDFVILREMTLRPGAPITKALLYYDQDRIYSLRLFNKVSLFVVPSDSPGLAHILVEVSERWYLFPYPIFGIRDRDWKKIFYGIGLLYYNFRGRNEKLFASFILGYDPSLSLSYRNPFLDQQGTYSLDGGISASRVHNRSILAQSGTENFQEHHIAVSLAIGKRFGIVHALSLRGGFEYVGIDVPMAGRTLSATGIDRYPTVSIGYSYDTRNLAEYPSEGTFFSGNMTKYGFPGKDIDYVRYAFDVRKFVPLSSSLTIAGRTFVNVVAAGATPSYNHTYFGYGDRIRGHFREVWEGEEVLGVTTELHYTLLPPLYFTIGKLPAEFSIGRFGIVVALFADAGTVWFRKQPLAINHFIRGYGAGLHFLLPYSIVLRTEYALNERRRGEFIIDVGSSL